MTELESVLAALAALAGAVWAPPVPPWLVVAWWLAAPVVGRRRPRLGPVVFAAGLLLTAAALASRAEAGVAIDRPSRSVAGRAEMVATPERLGFGTAVEVRLGGRRYSAVLDRARFGAIERAPVGATFDVVGRTGPLRRPWEWAATRHLAGELHVASIGPLRPGPWWWRGTEASHRVMADGVATLPPEARSLFLGLVLGDDGAQSEVERHRFRMSGLAHLLAVSGQNVAFVLLVVSPVLRRFPLGGRWAVTIVVLGWFALVARLEPSVLRAVSMAAVAATASWTGRYASGVRVLSLAVTGLVLIDPLLVWSVGFRLSVAASASLVTLARPLARSLPGPRVVVDLVAASIAAQVATAPLLVGWAGPVPALGVVWNVLAVPVAGWLMVWGMVTAPLAGLLGRSLPGGLGGLVGSWSALPSRAMVWWVSSVAHVGSWPRWPRLGGWGVLAVSIGVVTWAAGPVVWDRAGAFGRLVRPVVALAAVVAVFDLAVVSSQSEELASGSVRWWSAGGATVVDLGSRPSERALLTLVAQSRRSRVDVVIVTAGRSNAATAVWDLRQVIDVGTVLAADPSTVRDARQLDSGPIRAGGVELEVRRGSEGRWSVTATSGAIGRVGGAG